MRLKLSNRAYSYVINASGCGVAVDVQLLEQLTKLSHGKPSVVNIPLIYLSCVQLSVDRWGRVLAQYFSCRPFQRRDYDVQFSAGLDTLYPSLQNVIGLPVGEVF